LAAGLKKAGIFEGTLAVSEDFGTISIVLPSTALTNSAIPKLCINTLFITAQKDCISFAKTSNNINTPK
jgi:hypothetical protein